APSVPAAAALCGLAADGFARDPRQRGLHRPRGAALLRGGADAAVVRAHAVCHHGRPHAAVALGALRHAGGAVYGADAAVPPGWRAPRARPDARGAARGSLPDDPRLRGRAAGAPAALRALAVRRG